MKITIPDNPKKILDTIHEAGYEAYIVGGCVRDALLGREPKDWDITTNAMPCDIKKLFRRTVDTGIQHGTVTVMVGKEGYEVTTYRIDGKYEDSRHPNEVTFTRDLTEDVKRRDFTINAMAYNEEEGLIDRFGGEQDLKDRIIRCVGDPMARLTEDALRIMRAVRFAAQLDYEIEKDTVAAIKKLSPNLEKISAERIQTELVKIVTSDHPEKIRMAYELGITAVMLPEFDRCMETPQVNKHHAYNVGEHIIESMKHVRPDRILRLTMLLHDIAKPDTMSVDEQGISHFYDHGEAGVTMARGIFRRLKFDRDTMDTVCNLIRYHDDRFPVTAKNVRKMMNRVGAKDFPYWMEVRYADTMAQSEYMREEKLKDLEDIRREYQLILERNECITIRDLAVNGGDLQEAGIRPGPLMGQILDAMLQDVLEEPSHNTKDYLLEPERLRDVFMKDHGK